MKYYCRSEDRSPSNHSTSPRRISRVNNTNRQTCAEIYAHKVHQIPALAEAKRGCEGGMTKDLARAKPCSVAAYNWRARMSYEARKNLSFEYASVRVPTSDRPRREPSACEPNAVSGSHYDLQDRMVSEPQA